MFVQGRHLFKGGRHLVTFLKLQLDRIRFFVTSMCQNLRKSQNNPVSLKELLVCNITLLACLGGCNESADLHHNPL